MHHISCSFLVEHHITEVTQPPYSPVLSPCDLWLFPKRKSPLKGKQFQTISENQKKYIRAADGDCENGVRSQGAYFEGDWHVIVLCTMFLASCIFFNKYFQFSYYMGGCHLCDHILCYLILCLKTNASNILPIVSCFRWESKSGPLFRLYRKWKFLILSNFCIIRVGSYILFLFLLRRLVS